VELLGDAPVGMFDLAGVGPAINCEDDVVIFPRTSPPERKRIFEKGPKIR
jgi:hypothetical protein